LIKIGLIGCGKWGKNHARILSEIDCKFIGIADVNTETKELCKKYNVRYTENYRDLLGEVDAVSIVTPTDTHYEIVKECLQKGKHVLVEKPLTVNSSEALDLIEIAKKNKLILAVGHIFRFNPSVIKLKEILKDAGDLNYITMRYIHSHKPPRKDSGSIFNFGVHLFDILNFVLEKTPEKIFCKKVNYLSENLEDTAIVLADYGNYFALLEMGWFHPLKRRDAWFIGSEKKIYVDFLEQEINTYLIKITLKESKNKGKGDNKIDKADNPLKNELIHFIRSIKNNKVPINDGYCGYLTIKECESALESAKTGKEVIL
jgi:predicted dehydrogenase